MKIKESFIILILSFIVVGVNAERVEFNFFTNPQFSLEKINEANNFIEKNTADTTSVEEINFLLGDIFLSKNISDSLYVEKADSLKADYIMPAGTFTFNEKLANRKFYASNLKHEFFQRELIVEKFGKKIGFLVIYTPDYFVKNRVNSEIEIDYRIKKIADDMCKSLREEADFVIALTNLTLYTNQEIFKEIDLDAVISFDYQNKRNKKIYGKNIFTTFIEENRLLSLRIKDNSDEPFDWKVYKIKQKKLNR